MLALVTKERTHRLPDARRYVLIAVSVANTKTEAVTAHGRWNWVIERVWAWAWYSVEH